MSVRMRIVGNSFAIPVNKKVCRLLRFDHTTRFEMRLVGDRLVFEVVGRSKRQLTQDEIGYLIRQVERSELTSEQFGRLSGGGLTLRSFRLICSIRGAIEPALARRLFACFERRRVVKESWDATIDAVIAGLPGPIHDEDLHSIPPDELAEEISTQIDEDNAGGPLAKARAETAEALVRRTLDGARRAAEPDEPADEPADDFSKPLDESLYATSDEDPGEMVSIPL